MRTSRSRKRLCLPLHSHVRSSLAVNMQNRKIVLLLWVQPVMAAHGVPFMLFTRRRTQLKLFAGSPRKLLNLAESPVWSLSLSALQPFHFATANQAEIQTENYSSGCRFMHQWEQEKKNILALATSADPLFTIHKNDSTLRHSKDLNSMKVFKCLGAFCQYSYNLLEVFLNFELLKSRKQVKISRRQK